MKSLLTFITSFLFSLVMGLAFSMAVDVSPVTSVLGAIGLSFALSFMPLSPNHVHDVALKQMWETDLIENFRHEHSWLSRIGDKNEYVHNNIINLTDIGVDPEVLIDNKTYPIPVVTRDDDNIPVSLKKFDTENTIIPQDELYALPYDKKGSVQRGHREALEETTARYGLHSLAPNAAGTGKFIIVTSGEDDGTGRKRLTYADVLKLKKAYDDHGVPKRAGSRVLVLCNEHVQDLLLEDKKLTEQYHNHTEGAIAKNFCGFELHEDVYNPVYDASNEKKAYGAASAGTDRNASISFYVPRTFKARGDVKAFMRDAENDPENRRSTLGYQLWHIVLPTKQEGFGALISVPV